MLIPFVALLLFLAYVASRYESQKKQVKRAKQNQIVARPGVGVFNTKPAPNLPQQVLASRSTNKWQTTKQGFAPAFGPNEGKRRGSKFNQSV